jgi:hypothetical protein
MSDIEDLGVLEEIEPDEKETGVQDCRREQCVLLAQRSLQHTSAPAMLLDPKLRLVWANPAFRHSFAGQPPVTGQNLALYFLDSFDEKSRNALYRSVRSAEKGHCWYGRLEKRVPDQLAITANLLILPLFSGEESETPVAFQGILNDISADFRGMLKTTYQSLLEAARLKDNDTGNHIERVNRYCRLMAEALLTNPDYPEVDVEFVENMGFLSAMHDVGKIGTPDDILNKAGRFEPWEWEIMKEHTINGAYIMASYPNPMARDIALRHHERWNGTGYPHGLAGDSIPLCARIVAIADVYDALRMKRPYKEPLSHERACAVIREQRAEQFEPFLVDLFEKLERRFRNIYEELKEVSETEGRPPGPSEAAR